MTPLPSAVVVVCTKDRPAEMERLLSQLSGQTVVCPLLVVDAGVPDVQRLVDAYANRRPATWIRSAAGLAKQRNAAIVHLFAEKMPEIVCFLDDDVVISSDYVERVLSEFAANPSIYGLGAVVDDQRKLPRGLLGLAWAALKRVFLLDGAPGRVLPSGRNVMVRHAHRLLRVDWLPGSAMSYRSTVFARERFDDRLVGYSWGEDFDFSFRVSRRWPIAISPAVAVVNLLSPSHRLQTARLSQVRTVLLHAWVREQRSHGMKMLAFWWSVIGEILLQAALGLIRAEARAQCLGVARGAAFVLRSGSRRDISPST